MTDEQPGDRTNDEGEGQAIDSPEVDSPAFEPGAEGSSESSDEPAGSPAFDPEPSGNENIAEGRVGGLMGSPHATQGQGQGG